MITAEEARRITFNKDTIYKSNLSAEQILDSCYGAIKRFCKSENMSYRQNPSKVVNTCTGLSFTSYIPDAVKDKLVELGYKVTITHAYRVANDGYSIDVISISWGENNDSER